MKIRIVKSVNCPREGRRFKNLEDCIACEYFKGVDEDYKYVECGYEEDE